MWPIGYCKSDSGWLLGLGNNWDLRSLGWKQPCREERRPAALSRMVNLLGNEFYGPSQAFGWLQPFENLSQNTSAKPTTNSWCIEIINVHYFKLQSNGLPCYAAINNKYASIFNLSILSIFYKCSTMTDEN